MTVESPSFLMETSVSNLCTKEKQQNEEEKGRTRRGEGEERLQQTSAEIDAQVKQIKIDCRLELHSTITVNLSSKSCQQ